MTNITSIFSAAGEGRTPRAIALERYQAGHVTISAGLSHEALQRMLESMLDLANQTIGCLEYDQDLIEKIRNLGAPDPVEVFYKAALVFSELQVAQEMMRLYAAASRPCADNLERKAAAGPAFEMRREQELPVRQGEWTSLRQLAEMLNMDRSAARRYVLRLGFEPKQARTRDSGYQMALVFTPEQVREIVEARRADGYC